MTADERWLTAAWPFIATALPPAPAPVLDLGCGPLGGFAPALRQAGYQAIGVDPEAPSDLDYQRLPFEDYRPPHPFHAVIASLSLHHVSDVGDTVDQVADALAPAGVLIVLEWASERFDEATARWSFAQLGDDSEPSWLTRRRDEWISSGQPWDSYFGSWLRETGLHSWDDLRRQLERRFDARLITTGPYLFADLGASEADEQVAIDAGLIRPTGARFVGSLR
jgi:SAM-dependent methyltransferase